MIESTQEIRRQEQATKNRVRFDPTINLGHILNFSGMAGPPLNHNREPTMTKLRNSLADLLERLAGALRGGGGGPKPVR